MEDIKYIVWGTGWEAERFYYQYHDKIDIVYFVDNYNHGTFFYDYEVMKPEISILRTGDKILISSAIYYDQIKKQLLDMGFAEYKDFNYCFHFDKKIALIHGNCHCDIIRQYLQTSKKFSQEYIFKRWPLVFEPEEYDEGLLEYCDLFIYQDVRKENSINYKYSDEYILPKLKHECIKCCIPNLYGFPKALFYKNHQLSDNKHNCSKIEFPTPFLYQEEIIDAGMNKGDSFENIMKSLGGGAELNEPELLAQFEKDKEAIQKRELYWDIKITDYIYQQFKKEKLFYDIGHPTNIVLWEISNRILRFLNIEESVSEEIGTDLSCYEVPVYDCIKEVLKLEWCSESLRNKYNFILGEDEKMDLREYVREYIWWNYGKMEDVL